MVVEERSEAVLKSVGERVASRAASGRYVRSEPIRNRKVRYWATAKPRSREDHLGVQFYGDGVREAERYRRELESAGFLRHKPQPDKETFAKPVPIKADGAMDIEALNEAKRHLDRILHVGEGDAPAPRTAQPSGPTEGAALRTGADFLSFMQASPLAGVELDLPSREGGWRPVEL